MIRRSPSPRNAGYALLAVLFLAAAMLIAVAIATPPLLTQGRREKETELIWRGEQYARAIRLYYRKTGRFPQNVEDLVKPQNGIRFLRQEFKDPMNKEDGSWRLIYIGPNGQLVGSVRRQNILLPQAGASGQQGAESSESPETQAGRPGQPQASPAPASTGDDLAGRVFGGNIVGVGSKVDRASFKVYDKASNYREWEFLWDPTKEAVTTGVPPQPGAPQQPGTPLQPVLPTNNPTRPR